MKCKDKHKAGSGAITVIKDRWTIVTTKGGGPLLTLGCLPAKANAELHHRYLL